jgi:hypothetical protein
LREFLPVAGEPLGQDFDATMVCINVSRVHSNGIGGEEFGTLWKSMGEVVFKESWTRCSTSLIYVGRRLPISFLSQSSMCYKNVSVILLMELMMGWVFKFFLYAL